MGVDFPRELASFQLRDRLASTIAFFTILNQRVHCQFFSIIAIELQSQIVNYSRHYLSLFNACFKADAVSELSTTSHQAKIEKNKK